MPVSRRQFAAALGAAGLGTALPRAASGGDVAMYGLIGSFTAVPGQRDRLIAILLESAKDIPGCLSYVVARDTVNADLIWVTEVWDSDASHAASLSLPAVKAAIARGRPLIAGMGSRAVTTPVGGQGLP